MVKLGISMYGGGVFLNQYSAHRRRHVQINRGYLTPPPSVHEFRFGEFQVNFIVHKPIAFYAGM